MACLHTPCNKLLIFLKKALELFPGCCISVTMLCREMTHKRCAVPLLAALAKLRSRSGLRRFGFLGEAAIWLKIRGSSPLLVSPGWLVESLRPFQMFFSWGGHVHCVDSTCPSRGNYRDGDGSRAHIRGYSMGKKISLWIHTLNHASH